MPTVALGFAGVLSLPSTGCSSSAFFLLGPALHAAISLLSLLHVSGLFLVVFAVEASLCPVNALVAARTLFRKPF